MSQKKVTKKLEKLIAKYGFNDVASVIKSIDWNQLPTEEVAARCPPGYRWSVEFGRCLADPLD